MNLANGQVGLGFHDGGIHGRVERGPLPKELTLD